MCYLCFVIEAFKDQLAQTVNDQKFSRMLMKFFWCRRHAVCWARKKENLEASGCHAG